MNFLHLSLSILFLSSSLNTQIPFAQSSLSNEDNEYNIEQFIQYDIDEDGDYDFVFRNEFSQSLYWYEKKNDTLDYEPSRLLFDLSLLIM